MFIKCICKKKEMIRKIVVFFNYVCENKVKVWISFLNYLGCYENWDDWFIVGLNCLFVDEICYFNLKN